MKAVIAAIIVVSLGASAVSLGAGAALAQPQTIRSPSGKTIQVVQRANQRLDYAHLKPIPMPTTKAPPRPYIEMLIAASKARSTGMPELFPGGEGNGKQTPVVLAPPTAFGEGSAPQRQSPSGTEGGVTTQEYGASGQVYMTKRAPNANSLPYRKSGLINSNQGTCSGALIKRGVVLTAAHCIINWANRSANGGWTYTPGYTNGSGKYGTWTTVTGYLTDAYFAGYPGCSQNPSSCDCDTGSSGLDPGIRCTDDVGLLLLNPDSNGKYAGDYTGWFGYAVNGYSFTSGQAQITQLGYPAPLDNGQLMERTDSRGVVNTDPSFYNNTIIGSLMTEGASGGPWLVNFGNAPKHDTTVTIGSDAAQNYIVGVTSWAYTCQCTTQTSQKQNGASPFLSNTLHQLLYGPYGVCTDQPAACAASP